MNRKNTRKQNPVERYFILIVLLVVALALWKPTGFIWMKPHIPKLLGVIMFGMGVSLTFSDFKKLRTDKHLLLLGVSMQFIVMPLLAVLLSFTFRLSEEIFIGMVLVARVPEVQHQT